MSLLACLRCATRFAVGLPRCPHCLSEEFEEADVPKNTTWGGPSYPQEPGAAPAEAEAVPEPPAEPAPVEPEAAPEPPAPEPEPEPEPAPEPKPAPSLSRPAPAEAT